MPNGTVLDLHETEKADRVREHTSPRVQARIDGALVERVRHHAQLAGTDAGRAAIDARVAELEQESDVERLLEGNAATLAFVGTLLSVVHHRRWVWLPLVVTAFLLQHAVQGWCPPITVFRRLGVRTRAEIEVERYALKLLRGDLDVDRTHAGSDSAGEQLARRVIEAVTS
jgi:hypothetical protein